MSKNRIVLIVVLATAIRLFSATMIQTSPSQRSNPGVHSAAEWPMNGRKRVVGVQSSAVSRGLRVYGHMGRW